jgi:tetratricopeptide (TPR) repeat protein
MKKLILLSLVGLTYFVAVGQNNKVVTAFNYHKYYLERGKKAEDLVKAMEAIDEAANHEQTMGGAKTWFYRGKIYHSVYESKDDAFLGQKNNALGEAIKSYIKVIQAEKNKEWLNETMQRLSIAQVQSINVGVENFQNKSYEKALNAFETALGVAAMFQKVDTLALYNAALSAERVPDYKKAEQYYNALIEIKYGDANTFLLLAGVHKQQKNEEKFIEVVKKGRKAHPNDKGLIIEELNYYLIQGKLKEAISNLELAMEKDPSNHQLAYTLGNVFDNMANPTKDQPKPSDAEYKEYINRAEAAYKKALEIKPDYFDALYSIGALYYNEAAIIVTLAQDIKDNAKYAKEVKRADEKFELALPYLEKALEIEPKDKNTLSSLMQLYARTGQTDKYKQVKELLQN